MGRARRGSSRRQRGSRKGSKKGLLTLAGIIGVFALMSGTSDTGEQKENISVASAGSPSVSAVVSTPSPTPEPEIISTEIPEKVPIQEKTVIAVETTVPEPVTYESQTVYAAVSEPVNTEDDCGWVANAAWDGGGYCSYHPEWYGLQSFDTDQNNNSWSQQSDGSNGTSNYQTYNDPYSGPAQYIGNANSGVFHYSWCSSVSKMAPHNKVELYTRDDAVNYGYRPCQKCNP